MVVKGKKVVQAMKLLEVMGILDLLAGGALQELRVTCRALSRVAAAILAFSLSCPVAGRGGQVSRRGCPHGRRVAPGEWGRPRSTRCTLQQIGKGQLVMKICHLEAATVSTEAAPLLVEHGPLDGPSEVACCKKGVGHMLAHTLQPEKCGEKGLLRDQEALVAHSVMGVGSEGHRESKEQLG
ncbi:hypothetical protein NDU88_008791 [Pleurodeles waltl]|uniref:Uncharacterized protein n=1 Tax=Pleurodeles waltl TaxID=8319 RepID=A0AAV7PX66_PLEWA|nr:hypothetical protein NDU88_008791 [Pleurodeles waltl]